MIKNGEPNGVPDRGNHPNRRVFIANENGDWWEHTPGQKVYIATLQDLIDAGYYENEDEFDMSDGAEHAIKDVGTPINIPYAQSFKKKKGD